MKRNALIPAALIASAIALGACGGGNDDAAMDTGLAAPGAAAAPTTTPAPTTDTAAGMATDTSMRDTTMRDTTARDTTRDTSATRRP